MENILIHIGYHKTGTTWLQNELFVSKNETFQPLCVNGAGESSLARHFVFDETHNLLNPFDSNEKTIRRELKTILKAKQNREKAFFVMSHERLSGNPHSSGFDSSVIARRIKNVFPKGKILIVLREQKSFVVSNYFQYLSAGGTHGIYKYLNLTYDGKRPDFSPNHIDYYPLVSRYQELFGAENVLVLPYELFVEDGLAFLEKLSSFIGKKIELDERRLNVVWNKKTRFFLNYYFRFLNFFKTSSSLNNYSFLANDVTSPIALFLSELFAIMIPDFLNKRLLEKVNSVTYNWAAGRYVDSNKRLSEIINLDLGKFGYY